MALALAQAKKLLRQIVGGNGFTTVSAPYLGLSKNPPKAYATKSGEWTNYNILEPGATEYTRVQLGTGYFEALTGDAEFTVTDETADTPFTVSITNTKEIHFSEATTNWGFYKYFFITTSSSKNSYTDGSVIYVGELAYDKYREAGEVAYTEDNGSDVLYTDVPAITSEALFTTHKSNLYVKDAETDEFVKVAEDAVYDGTTDTQGKPNTRYYALSKGVAITKNTVPLVRKNSLKISVQ